MTINWILSADELIQVDDSSCYCGACCWDWWRGAVISQSQSWL